MLLAASGLLDHDESSDENPIPAHYRLAEPLSTSAEQHVVDGGRPIALNMVVSRPNWLDSPDDDGWCCWSSCTVVDANALHVLAVDDARPRKPGRGGTKRECASGGSTSLSLSQSRSLSADEADSIRSRSQSPPTDSDRALSDGDDDNNNGEWGANATAPPPWRQVRHSRRRRLPTVNSNGTRPHTSPLKSHSPTHNVDKYKTALCKSVRNNRLCSYGDKCLFAHGKNELRGNGRPRRGRRDRQ